MKFMKKLILFVTVCLMASRVVVMGSLAWPVFQMRLVLNAPAGDSEPMMLITKNQYDSFTNVLNVQKVVLLDQTAVKLARPG